MRVDELTYSSAISQILRWAEARESRYVCVSTVHMVMEAYDDPDFQAVVNNADLVGSDGVPVIWVSRWLGLTCQERVFAPELVLRLCESAARTKIPVGFYGSTQAVLLDLVQKIRERVPGLDVVYAYSPPFRALSDDESGAIVADIAASGAQIVFVGLGCPKQERWMRQARPDIKAVMLGVGWAFDVCSGHSRTAPEWMQRMGMEWFYRLLQNPAKLWKRHVKNNPRFIILVAAQLLRVISQKIRTRFMTALVRPLKSGPP